MEIFEEIEKLNLPKDDFVVLGSGILSALGIRELGDVDLLVKLELFEKLKKEGWKYEIVEIDGHSRKKVSRGGVEIFMDFWWEGDIHPFDVGAAVAEKVKGINFIPLSILLNMKRQMVREKDLKDIKLIETYLASK